VTGPDGGGPVRWAWTRAGPLRRAGRGAVPACDRGPGAANVQATFRMTASAYLPFLIQAVLAAAITGGVIAASHFFGQRFKPNKIKDSAYECGVPAEGVIHTRFSVKFYLTALLFMLFDLEVVILIPWTFIYREFLANNIAILGPIFFFIGVLILGLIYEVKKGALQWEK
jgi:NADH-quinone oxidoreductase subunit A